MPTKTPNTKPKQTIKYTTVSIPDFLIRRVDTVVDNKNKYGYQNRTDFVFEAIRKRLRELGEME